ncbi:hypothetical protein JW756_05485 [Candidatus Woesearchaeota archaeon]|nr:hypothetical protein [Candidatus Woesearchaeota archaeon]
MNKMLKWAAIAAVINAIIVIPGFILGFLTGYLKDNLPVKIITLLLLIIGLIAGLLVLNGYFILSKKLKLKFLHTMTLIGVVFTVVLTGVDFLLVLIPSVGLSTLTLWLLVMIGLVEILFGISIFKLKKKLGRLPLATGILYIVSGALYATLFLAVMGPLIGLATSILEVILLSKAAKKF